MLEGRVENTEWGEDFLTVLRRDGEFQKDCFKDKGFRPKQVGSKDTSIQGSQSKRWPLI